MKTVDDFLEHFGVRGMRWGIRKAPGSPPGPASAQDVKITRAKAGKSVRATGGKGHAPTAEALRAVAIKQKARASGTQSLTNQEIQEALTRMNLEKNFYTTAAKYNPNVVQRGQRFIKEVVGLQGSAEEVRGLINSPQGRAIKAELEKHGANLPKLPKAPEKS